MQILSVYDREFSLYGAMLGDVDPAITGAIAAALENGTPLPDGVGYVPEDPVLQNLPEAEALAPTLFGGLPVQFGWCNGHNVKLNCLEYHRTSEFNLGPRDFVLLLARQADIRNHLLSTATVRAFLVPAGTLVEIFATTLHYAPCQASDDGFKVLIALPRGTNLEMPELAVTGGDSKLLWASNKWLLAHPDSDEAAAGAHKGLIGRNIDIEED